MNNEKIKLLIEQYKKRLSQTNLKNEKYKWELLAKYEGRPNLEVENLSEEIKQIDYSNLVYAMSKAVLYYLTNDRQEKMRVLFNSLFNESIALSKRINDFSEASLSLYRELEPKLSHHQDERSISTYLTFKNPEKYTFYKSSFYKKYCALLGVKPKNKNEKLVHYYELIDDLIEHYIKEDKELIDQVKNCIPAYYDGTNHLLLAQDILYQLDYEGDKRYWVFQGNLKYFNITAALNDGNLLTWRVKKHKNKIKKEDKIILWVAGKDSGCYALATVKSEVEKKKTSEAERPYYTEIPEGGEVDQVDLTIDYNFATNPIGMSAISSSPTLSKLKIGISGTNFSATKQEYEALLALANRGRKKYWLYSPGSNAMYLEEFLELGIMAIGWDELGDLKQYGTRDKITEAIRKTSPDNDRRNDISANDDFLNEMNVGDVVILKRGRKEFLGYGVVTSDYYYDSSRTYFQKCRKVDWQKSGVWPSDGKTVVKTLTDITPDVDYVYELKILLGIDNSISLLNNKNQMKLSKNTILYGPPGTGKTYFLKNNLMERFTSKEDTITKDEYIKNVIQESSWWQVIGLVLLEIGHTKVPDIARHQYVKLKLEASNTKTVNQNIWSQLQSHTIDDCPNVRIKRKMTPLFFNKTADSFWEVSMSDLEEQAPDLLELKEELDNFELREKKEIKRYDFLTFHQSYSYEDFIEGIKPELTDSDVAYRIEEGVFQKMCNRARVDSNNDYAIFIDEINRGNISAIFGELITLIEEDKREGEANELSATLPYSKNKFSVPSNLFIIGTMNTADRSVEALDTALRRRFSFIEMNPEAEKLNLPEFKCEGIDIAKLLNTINNRIEKLLDKDYCIGHSYFMNILDQANPLLDLIDIFKNKILPLLQEYFYGDWGKIMLIIGEGFVSRKVETVNFLARNSYEDIEEYIEKPIYSFTDSSNWSMSTFRAIYD